MHPLAILCVGAYAVMSAFVGARLVMRSIPARGLPELLMGLAYLMAPGVGYPLAVIGSLLQDRSAGPLMFAAGEALIVLGCTCFFFFNARVFRPASVLAQGAAALGAILFAISGSELVRGHIALGPNALNVASVRAASVTMLAVLGLAYAWTAYEGFRHQRMMQRRARVGLGDPVVANRFLLWAVAGSLQMVADAVSAYALHSGGDITTDPASLLATSLVGVVNSALLVLIFIPPPAYTRWLARDPQAALAVV